MRSCSLSTHLVSLASLAGVLVACGSVALGQNAPSAAPLRAVPMSQVKITGGFLAQRQAVNSARTVWANFEQCEKTGRIANLKRAAAIEKGEHKGYFFDDSDVYKAMEGASFVLAAMPPSPERTKLDAYLDDLIATIAKAQLADGYIYTFYQLGKDGGLASRFTNLKDNHEMYCLGHLIEAAVAHHQATGKKTLLDVAVKAADMLDNTFGKDKRAGVCGHEEIELALIKLSRDTGNKKYEDLARYFVETRGHAELRELYGEYAQDHVPIREQDKIVGHAVRATYFYSAATDLLLSKPDPTLSESLERVWTDLTTKKMYVTGGIGSSGSNEGFTTGYDLPNDTAYAETCAGIGLLMWNHRMGLMSGDSKYADTMETGLYNGVLSGISLDGERFLYVNPLSSKGQHHRVPWYGCACCPPNILRLIASIGGYAYAQTDDRLVVNLYTHSEAMVKLAGTDVKVTQTTDYPWGDSVAFTVAAAKPAKFTVSLRVPAWCAADNAKVSGTGITAIQTPAGGSGYINITRTWAEGDTFTLTLPMPPKRITSHPAVKFNRGRVALQRGPVVYCVEGIDNAGSVHDLVLPPSSPITPRFENDLLGGVTVLEARAIRAGRRDSAQALYAAVSPPAEVTLKAVPYFAWDNRQDADRAANPSSVGQLAVWLAESQTLALPGPDPSIKPSASHCFESDTLTALCDGLEPADSGDGSIPRFTWWPRRSSEEWAALEFAKPRRVSEVEVYWFDDRRHGAACAVPESWRLEYKSGDQWVAVEPRDAGPAGAAGTAQDRYNQLRFKPVTTSGLRIVAKLQIGLSGGILEWKVGP